MKLHEGHEMVKKDMKGQGRAKKGKKNRRSTREDMEGQGRT